MYKQLSLSDRLIYNAVFQSEAKTQNKLREKH